MLRSVAVLGLTMASLVGCGIGAAAPPEPEPTATSPPNAAPQTPQPSASPTSPNSTSAAPNIVYVLVDDMSADLIPYMDNVQALAAEGVSFDNFFVTTSLCCPSRASTLTGMYAHNTTVLTNGWPLGGFMRFLERDPQSSLGPALQDAGYRTGYLGKYMNGYEPGGSAEKSASDAGAPPYPEGYVPLGWDEWHVPGTAGYRNFRYSLATAIDESTATVERFGGREEDYLSDVLAGRAEDFIDRAVSAAADDSSDQPFFLAVAPFGVHVGFRDDPSAADPRFPAAPRDRPAVDAEQGWPHAWDIPAFPDGDCGRADADGGCDDVAFPPPEVAGSFNVKPTHRPAWMRRSTIGAERLAELEVAHLDRIRMAQSIDDLVGRVRDGLVAAGVDDETYIVVNSDNGFHLGAHALRSGKLTAYDHDVRVPLIIRPPGGTAPRTVSAISQNIDLLPTFVELAGSSPRRSIDGVSLMPLIEGVAPDEWRSGALVEYHQDDRLSRQEDPDSVRGQEPTTYNALRTADYLYVDYSVLDEAPPGRREAELYDLAADPDQLQNVVATLRNHHRRALNKALLRYTACSGVRCQEVARDLPTLRWSTLR